jgi:hypothetical protein
VLFYSYNDFISNFRTNINGPSSPYTYEYAIDQTAVKLVEAEEFTQMKVSISNILATIKGGGREKIEFWWADSTIIQDPSNNTLTEGKIVGYLNFYEYIPASTENAAKGGGSSLKYTLISMFSINMGLKFAIKSSAALMWSLIHVLQLFRYILMINIKMPGLIAIVMKYLGVVIGEVDEMEEIFPDVLDTYIINGASLNVNATVLPRFAEYGYESPYVNQLHGKQITMFTAFIIIGIPLVYFLSKIFKNVKYLGPKFGGMWVGIFWNGPIRTFIELYIEICLAFFMHTFNIRFMNYSGVIATLF